MFVFCFMFLKQKTTKNAKIIFYFYVMLYTTFLSYFANVIFFFFEQCLIQRLIDSITLTKWDKILKKMWYITFLKQKMHYKTR